MSSAHNLHRPSVDVVRRSGGAEGDVDGENAIEVMRESWGLSILVVREKL